MFLQELKNMYEQLLNEIEVLKEKAIQPPIPKWKIEYSEKYADRIFKNKEELFVTLCSLNLLNAAAKMSFYRKSISYRLIKGGVSKLLMLLVSPKQQEKYDVSVSIDRNTAYISIFNLQFSFHQVTMNDFILSYSNSDRNEKIEWEGVTLQMIAEELFDLSYNVLLSH